MNPTAWPNHGIDLNIPQANEGQADQLSMADTSGSHNEQPVGFGQAMFTLLEANDQTWLTSFKRLRSGTDPKGKKTCLTDLILCPETHIVCSL